MQLPILLRRTFSLLIIAVLLFSGTVSGQTKADFPQDYFRSPVDFKIYLSGTFGEPRSTHYHTGLDIKTQGVTGKNLYAIADGYVSRIKVSPYGYGNALYITHPNGYTSVYAHMKNFSEEIEAYTTSEQNRLTLFEVDLDSLPKDLLTVTKGEVIGLSGNSGGSGGPHLHFEIRDSFERPINPLLFGFDNMVVDEARPGIYNIVVYNRSSDRQFSASKTIKPSNLGSGKYSIASTIKVNRNQIGLGVHSVDKFTGTSNSNGVYEILLYFDNELAYHYQMSRISFDHTKHVYSQCDYWKKVSGKQTVYKCFKEPGNNLTAHPYMNNNGELYLPDSEVHNVRIEVKDFHGNTSSVALKVQYDESTNYFPEQEFSYNEYFDYNKRNSYIQDNLIIEMKRETLFDDLFFQYQEKPNELGISNGFQIQDVQTPVAQYYQLRIKPIDIDSNLIDKYLIVRKDHRGRTRAIDDTEYKRQFFAAESKNFGLHYVSIDTIPPKITPVDVYEKKKITSQKYITLKATDNLSGIEEYNAFLNGEWVLLSYEAKRAKFTYKIDELLVPGENYFEVIISDERSNASVYSVTLLH